MFLEVVAFITLLNVATPVSTGWRPINRPLLPVPPAIPHQTLSYQSHIPEPSEDGCTLYKALFDHETSSQYVQYKAPIPDMKEFTLCMWHKFYNHSRDQPLFTYSSSHERARDIYSWVSNSEVASYYMLSVMGQTMYRLNYPVRLHKWYHSCQSWNGRTGEWQIWINSERIGRGFHNLLVGKTIKGGGTATSGQEPINNAVRGYQDLYKPTGGLMGEVTLVQLYKAALTAGKAYTNHKHHHAHHFHHDDKLGEDDYRHDGINPPPSQEPLNTGNEYPFLKHGQLIPSLPVHELSAFRGQQSPHSPQFNVLGTSLLGPGNDSPYNLPRTRIYKRDQLKEVSNPTTKTTVRRVIRTKSLKDAQPLDTDEEDEIDEKLAFKRDVEKVDTDDSESVKPEERKDTKRDVKSVDNQENEKNIPKREVAKSKKVNKGDNEKLDEIKKVTENVTFKKDMDNIAKDKKEETDRDSKTTSLSKTGEREKRSNKEEKNTEKDEEPENNKSKSKRETEQTEKVQKKRTALLGDSPFGVIPGADLSGLFAGEGYILGAGGLKFNDDNNHHQSEEVQMEPAEWEVRSIMAVCSGCTEDPFRKATLISWRETPKKLFSGVLYIPAIPECQRF